MDIKIGIEKNQRLDQLQLVPSGGDSGPRRTSTELDATNRRSLPGEGLDVPDDVRCSAR
jgi:hypothetical protein